MSLLQKSKNYLFQTSLKKIYGSTPLLKKKYGMEADFVLHFLNTAYDDTKLPRVLLKLCSFVERPSTEEQLQILKELNTLFQVRSFSLYKKVEDATLSSVYRSPHLPEKIKLSRDFSQIELENMSLSEILSKEDMQIIFNDYDVFKFSLGENLFFIGSYKEKRPMGFILKGYHHSFLRLLFLQKVNEF